MHCKDTDTPIKIVTSIKNPRNFMTLLEENVDIQRDRYRVRGRDMIGLDVDCECDHDSED